MHVVTATNVEAFAHSLRPLLGLQANHAFCSAVRGDASFAHALSHWTMILGMPIDHGRTPEEADAARGVVLQRFEDVFRRHAPAQDLAAFRRDAAPLLDQAVDRFLARWRSEPPADTWYGCFRYGVERQAGLVSLHFYNAVMPDSPFADSDALVDDLRQCLRAVVREAPGTERVQCGSWVNNLPPIQAILPRTYIESLTPTDPDAKTGLGWWGQFVTNEGNLNAERAEHLLSTGEFRYPRLLGRCSLAEALAHLDC